MYCTDELNLYIDNTQRELKKVTASKQVRTLFNLAPIVNGKIRYMCINTIDSSNNNECTRTYSKYRLTT